MSARCFARVGLYIIRSKDCNYRNINWSTAAEEFFYTGNLREKAINNFFTAHKCNLFSPELNMAEIRLIKSEEDEEWGQQHYICFKIQHLLITLVLSKEHINVLFYSPIFWYSWNLLCSYFYSFFFRWFFRLLFLAGFCFLRKIVFLIKWSTQALNFISLLPISL